jgi:hypothetical protein
MTVRVVRLPWAEPHSHFTALFERMAIEWLKAACFFNCPLKIAGTSEADNNSLLSAIKLACPPMPTEMV